MLRSLMILLPALLLAACATTPKHPEPQPQTLLFDVDSAELRPVAAAYIDQLSDFLASHKNYDVVIEAHTDSTASNDYNLKLAQRRAHAVQSRLAANGIAPSRSTAVAYGEERPAEDNSTKPGRQQNRRVVVTVVQREMPLSAPNAGPPKYNYTSTDPKIEGTTYNSGLRPTHR